MQGYHADIKGERTHLPPQPSASITARFGALLVSNFLINPCQGGIEKSFAQEVGTVVVTGDTIMRT